VTRAFVVALALALLAVLTVAVTHAAPTEPVSGGSGFPSTMPNGLAGEGTWYTQRSGVKRTLRDVVFVNNLVGWVVGGERDDDCLIIHTIDGGLSWYPQFCPRARRLEAVDFVNDRVGWAVGLEGQMLHTVDGGASWFRQNVNTKYTVTDIKAWDENLAWATLRTGQVIKTVDGGRDWSIVDFGNRKGLFGIDFVDPNNGWITGSGGLMMRTTDGGITWHQQDFRWDDRFMAVDFVDGNFGWVAGSGIKWTWDGGIQWRSQARHVIDKSLEDISMPDSQYGWVVGDEGTIFRTVDRGEHWVRDAAGMTRRGLRGVHFIDRYEGWVVGTGGKIFHYVAPRPAPTEAATPTPKPTKTPLPSPTATSTPLPTATPTPSGPWISVTWPEGPILAAPGQTTRFEVSHGNIEPPAVLTCTLQGDVVFDMLGIRGKQVFTDTIFSPNRTWSVLVRAGNDADPGQTFAFGADLQGASVEREGVFAFSLLLPVTLR